MTLDASPRRRARRFVLATVMVLLFAAGAVALIAWMSAGRLIARTRESVANRLQALRAERVERPTLYEPVEEGNCWELIAQANDQAKAWSREVWNALSLDSDGKLPVKTTELVRDAQLSSIAPEIELIRRALRRRYTEPYSWTEKALEDGEPHVLGLNRLVGVLNGAILHRQNQGRHVDAADLIRINLGLADRLHVKSSAFGEINAGLAGFGGFQGIRRFLADPGVPVEVILGLANSVESLARASQPQVIDQHRRMALGNDHQLVRIYDDEAGAREMAEKVGFLPGFRDAWTWRLFTARWITLEGAEVRRLQGVADRPAAEWVQRVWPLRYPSEPTESSRHWHLVYMAESRLALTMARVSLAVAVYREREHRWPRDLKDALPEVPLDPWTLLPLRIEERDGDAWVLAPGMNPADQKLLTSSQFKAEDWRSWKVSRR